MSYAILLVPTFRDYDKEPRSLGRGIKTWIGRLKDHFDEPDPLRWLAEVLPERERTRVLEDELRIVLAKSERDLGFAWWALLLTEPCLVRHGPGETFHVFVGEAATETVTVKFTRPNKHTLKPALVRPFYMRTKRYHHLEGKSDWRSRDAAFLARWAETVPRLRKATSRKMPPILHVALEAYENGLRQQRIDFRLTAFVRAAECVLALPKGRRGGAITFGKRAMQVGPPNTQPAKARTRLAGHWFLGRRKGLDAKFKELFDQRSTCVHGKLPFPNLYVKRKRTAAENKAAYFEFLAEALARECILEAIRDPRRYEFFKDPTRAALEAAWDAGHFP